MSDLRFIETQFPQKSPEEVGRTIPGASHVMNVAIHTDTALANVAIDVICDGQMMKVAPSLLFRMGALKGDTYTFIVGKFEPNEPIGLTIYSKTPLHVLKVTAHPVL